MEESVVKSEVPLVVAIRHHRSRIAGALRRAGVSAADVDDLTQEVLTIFCRRFSDIAEPARLSFLLETARRVASDYRRLKWNRAVVAKSDMSLIHADQLPAEELIEQRQACELVNDALCALSQVSRRIFLLNHFEGWSRGRIAAHFDLPVGTVASRLRAANDVFAGTVGRLIDLDRLSQSTFGRSLPWSAPARRLPGVVTLAKDAAPLRGTHHYVNNRWGRARSTSGYDQCLVERVRDGCSELGWSWNWPGFHSDGFALPELLIGWKPWMGGRSTDSRFPVALDRIQRLSVDFHVEQSAHGAHELVLNLWLLRSKPADGFANPDLISAEIMIAFTRAPRVSEREPVESLTLGGVPYDFTQQSQAQGRRIEPWPLLNVRRCQPTCRASFDIAEMLRVLESRGHLQGSGALASIEFGHRVFGGEGTAWICQFDLDFVAQP